MSAILPLLLTLLYINKLLAGKSKKFEYRRGNELVSCYT